MSKTLERDQRSWAEELVPFGDARLPNFLLVGAHKAGTSSLYWTLREHPDIFLPKPADKELHFFDDPERYQKGISFYREFFAACHDQPAIGEMTPAYLYVNEAPERIYNTLGAHVRFIVIFRDPVARALSHYYHSVRKDEEACSFSKALKLEPKRIQQDFASRVRWSYVDRGRYATQLKRYLKFFPKENFFFIIFEEEWLENRAQTLSRLLSFLGVRQRDLDLNIYRNAARDYKRRWLRNWFLRASRLRRTMSNLGIRWFLPDRIHQMVRSQLLRWMGEVSAIQKQMDPEMKTHLVRHCFLEEIKELEDILGRDLSIWYQDVI